MKFINHFIRFQNYILNSKILTLGRKKIKTLYFWAYEHLFLYGFNHSYSLLVYSIVKKPRNGVLVVQYKNSE